MFELELIPLHLFSLIESKYLIHRKLQCFSAISVFCWRRNIELCWISNLLFCKFQCNRNIQEKLIVYKWRRLNRFMVNHIILRKKKSFSPLMTIVRSTWMSSQYLICINCCFFLLCALCVEFQSWFCTSEWNAIKESWNGTCYEYSNEMLRRLDVNYKRTRYSAKMVRLWTSSPSCHSFFPFCIQLFFGAVLLFKSILLDLLSIIVN